MTRSLRPRPGRIRPQPRPPVTATPGKRASNDARSAAIGAIVGTVAASLIGYVGIYQQIRAEDARSTTAFLREKQQAEYAQLIVDGRALQRLTNSQFYGAVISATETSLEDRKSLQDASVRFSQDVSNISLIGSPHAAKIANDMYEVQTRNVNLERVMRATHEVRMMVCVGIGEDRVCGGGNAPSKEVVDAQQDDIRKRYESLLEDLSQLELDFIQQARKDLGTE